MLRELILTFLMAATFETSARGEDESDKLSTFLTKNLTCDFLKERAQIDCIEKSGSLIINDQAVRIVPVSENSGETHGKYFSAARFEIELKGALAKNLTYGVVGIGDSLESARETAVQEWYLGLGAALLKALAGKPAALKQDGWEIYCGALGLRGEVSKDWMDGSDSMNRKVLSQLSTKLPKDRFGLHVLDLKVLIAPEGATDGECRMDGVPSVEILAALKGLPWPKSNASYIFKQAYVLKALP